MVDVEVNKVCGEQGTWDKVCGGLRWVLACGLMPRLGNLARYVRGVLCQAPVLTDMIARDNLKGLYTVY